MDKKADIARVIAEAVREKGGKCYYVGGCVRDKLLGRHTKDFDIEVHGIEPQPLREVLSSIGELNEYGSSFGIFSLKGYDIDIAMPRKETCRGSGHRDFDIFVDPFLGEEKAALRRDFTINALMQDVLSGEILDFFGGVKDLETGVIRHVNDKTFPEDPLRVLRGCQFAARLGFKMDESTLELCRNIDISTLAVERVFAEMEKALMGAPRPSIFFENLRLMNKLSPYFAYLEKLIGVPQPPKHHPEGDVWTHTMMVLNKAAEYRSEAKRPLYFMIAALCHDFGKPLVTKEEEGIIRSIGHEHAGLGVISEFLYNITSEKDLIRYVLNMAELHMRPNALVAQNSGQKSFNKVFDLSVCPEDLMLLSKCDHEGRGMDTNYAPIEEIMHSRFASFKELMARPYVMGRDLVDAGLVPDRNFTQILEYAHKLRLGGVDKGTALAETLSFARRLKTGEK